MEFIFIIENEKGILKNVKGKKIQFDTEEDALNYIDFNNIKNAVVRMDYAEENLATCLPYKDYLESLKQSSKEDLKEVEEQLEHEPIMIEEVQDTFEQGYYNAVEHLQKEFEKRTEADEEFNGMTLEDAVDELDSWDFVEAFGDDAERLSDAIKRIKRFFGKI